MYNVNVSKKTEKLKKAYNVNASKKTEKLKKCYVVGADKKLIKLWGGGKYIAACSGSLLTSDDGITWTAVQNDTMGWSDNIVGFYFINGIYVIISYTTSSGSYYTYDAYYSSDCVTWSVKTGVCGGKTIGSGKFFQCNNKIIAFRGMSGYYSEDAVTWTLVNTVTYASYSLASAIGSLVYGKYNNGYYYIAGCHDYTGRTGAQIAVSQDLVNWTNIYSWSNSQASGLPKPSLVCIDDEVYAASNGSGNLNLVKVLSGTASTGTNAVTVLENAFTPGSGVSGSPSLSYDEESDNLIITGSGLYGSSYKVYTSRGTSNDGYTSFTGSYAKKNSDNKRITLSTTATSPTVTSIKYTEADFYDCVSGSATWTEVYSASATSGEPIPVRIRYFDE